MTRTTIALAAAALTGLVPAAQAQETTFGLLGGISGPIAAMAPSIVDAGRLAFDQVNDQGGLLDGRMIAAAVGDSACSDQQGGSAAAKLLNVNGATAIVGAHCSGASIAAANTATIPAGVLLVSPASTSPAITALDDNDTVFRTVPSDDYQGSALARTLIEQGYGPVAVTYLNNDYGVGLAEAFRDEYQAQGGEVAAFSAHEAGKSTYRAELAELSRAGADTLVVFDYGDGSGLTILREGLENGFFERYVGGDGMKSDNVIAEIGAENLDTYFTSSPVGAGGEGLERFRTAFAEAGGDPDAIFATSGYDAAFLLALAHEHAGGDPAKMSASLRAVATTPGEAIYPGEWAKAKELIAAGEEIDYRGAAGDMEFDMSGDVPGNFGFFNVKDGAYNMVLEMQ